MNVIYSKIKDKNWPRLNFILRKMTDFVNKGTLIVKLYDADERKILEEEKPLRFDNLKIKLMLEINGSQASKGLKEDLNGIDSLK
jgi:hypothetical protein